MLLVLSRNPQNQNLEEVCVMSEKDNKWYAVYTKSRAEKKVKMLLDRYGINNYLPLMKVLRQWSDRKKWVEEPLIRSYIFVHIADDKEYLRVLETDHVVRFITFQGKPAIIPDHQIENIQLLLASEHDLEVTPEEFEKGDEIEVIAGQLKGLQGSLIEKRGRKRVQVKLEAIGQSILVEVAIAYLKKKNRQH